MQTTSTSASEPPPGHASLLSEQRATVVCERCELAERPLARLRGLLGRGDMERGAGMLLRPSGSIHTFFMRFPIDAVFLDAELRVLEVRPWLRPWRVAGRRGARAVLELAAGEAKRRGIAPGERLRIATPSAGAGASGGAG